jgi:hypothetical protein
VVAVLGLKNMHGNKNKKLSEAHKRKISAARKRQSPPTLGFKHTLATRKKMSDSRIGVVPWNWAGGVTPLNKRIYYSYKYRQWRSDVFTRDDFTCVICSKRGGEIEADHFPVMYAEIRDKNKIESYEQAMECEELWNINNGRTLCKECHKKYGRKVKNKFW